jgi:hypothetical protein
VPREPLQKDARGLPVTRARRISVQLLKGSPQLQDKGSASVSSGLLPCPFGLSLWWFVTSGKAIRRRKALCSARKRLARNHDARGGAANCKYFKAGRCSQTKKSALAYSKGRSGYYSGQIVQMSLEKAMLAETGSDSIHWLPWPCCGRESSSRKLAGASPATLLERSALSRNGQSSQQSARDDSQRREPSLIRHAPLPTKLFCCLICLTSVMPCRSSVAADEHPGEAGPWLAQMERRSSKRLQELKVRLHSGSISHEAGLKA